MADLNNVKAMEALDPVHVLSSVKELGLQCDQAWKEASTIPFPDSYKKITSVVFSAMGGSALGAYAIQSLYADALTVPFEVFNDYHIPSYVNEHTLVILGSYSGTTEETLASFEEAVAKKACITGITTGNTLEKEFQKRNIPYYKINPTHNPANQPRMGTGYSIIGQLAMLTTLGILRVTEKDIASIVDTLVKGNERYAVDVPLVENAAKILAKTLDGKIPVIVTAEFLGHTGRIIRNYFHETGKCFAAYHIIPEMNHHLMEGLTNPKNNKDILSFIFFNSSKYSDRIKKRIAVTKDVIEKHHISIDTFETTSANKLTALFECVQFAGYVNYYMAMLYDLDPSKIPWVDYFKKELGK